MREMTEICRCLQIEFNFLAHDDETILLIFA